MIHFRPMPKAREVEYRMAGVLIDKLGLTVPYKELIKLTGWTLITLCARMAKVRCILLAEGYKIENVYKVGYIATKRTP